MTPETVLTIAQRALEMTLLSSVTAPDSARVLPGVTSAPVSIVMLALAITLPTS